MLLSAANMLRHLKWVNLLGLVVRRTPHFTPYLLILGPGPLVPGLNADMCTRQFWPPLNYHCIVFQPGISLPHGVRCCQEGHQTGQGKCVCVLLVLSTCCMPTGTSRLWMWRQLTDINMSGNTNSINTKRECFLGKIKLLLQKCEVNRTYSCQLVFLH